jgi:hypothetical protein
MTLLAYIKRNRLPDGRMPMNWLAHYRMLHAKATQTKHEER